MSHVGFATTDKAQPLANTEPTPASTATATATAVNASPNTRQRVPASPSPGITALTTVRALAVPKLRRRSAPCSGGVSGDWATCWGV